jgi:hypothetical protein
MAPTRVSLSFFLMITGPCRRWPGFEPSLPDGQVR